YLYSQHFFAGYSNSQVFQTKVSFGDVTNAKLKTHHYLIMGHRFDLDEDWSITPNFLLKYMQPAPMALDINARVDYLDRFFFGFSYRHQDAVVGVLGININGFKLGYSYDFTISTLRKQNSGGHEIVLGYKWAVGGKKS
ncbi:MAG: PorP/SprF family type IX secretion system membrane protein, partial [Flavobacteriales bacterium]